ncbi:LysR substrate-binding domain-containing protein [Rhizobium sp. TRM95111]|uniref:LysR substrate-binding domain-containing protein n=1 Tax=Rhizobium alarense TaxID=2846851 RepID=UPI001F17C08C|nr:LysR substrate-binding domain-containing protein [Rhizobium alarense]MCF3639389.1 LysR substrate-binding domain-containing protein [Rhizobium alarense]
MLDRIPLECFRVFDAACRHMNFSRAGRELQITQAAVSHRIRGLEDHLGARLFERAGKNLRLTPQGERLFQRVRSSLDYLEESLEPFHTGGEQPITIAASGSVSHLWLGPRLRTFIDANPGAAIRLITSDSPVDLASENNDLVILYTTGEHPRWHLSPLMMEELAPVAAPGYVAAAGIDPQTVDLALLRSLDLIDYDRFNANWISFRQWFSRVAPNDPPSRVRPRFTFSNYGMAIDAALRGDGVALGSLGLLERHLAAGSLLRLGGASLATGYGYYLGLPRFRTASATATRLHLSLLAAQGAAASPEDDGPSPDAPVQ